MELRHLRYFIAAAEEEHFGRASDRLHITRPAVSQIIADLEFEIGTELFERQNHRVKLTAAGRALLPQLQRMMNDLNQVLAMAKQVGEGKTGVLNIGYGGLTLLHPLFRAATKKFLEKYPDVTLSLHEIKSQEQPKALAAGRIHAGFMHYVSNSAKGRKRSSRNPIANDEIALDRFQIQSGTLGVVMPIDHPLARRKSVSLAQLAGERFVVVPSSGISPGYGSLRSLCQKAGFEPRIVQEVASIATQLNLVSVGIGIGLLITGKNFVYPPTLAVVRLNNVNYATAFVLGWMKGRVEPVLGRFIEIVKELA